MKAIYLGLIAVTLWYSVPADAEGKKRPSRWASLCERYLTHAFLPMPAASEQKRPMIVGATPLEQRLAGDLAEHPMIPRVMKATGERQFAKLLLQLGLRSAELEVWPTWDERGRLRWVAARVRVTPRVQWEWLDLEDLRTRVGLPILPKSQRTDSPAALRALLDGGSGLYDKPAFADGIWTSPNGEVLSYWVNPDKKSAARREISKLPSNSIFRLLPRVPDFNGEPMSFVVRVSKNGGVQWPEAISWQRLAKKTAKSSAKLPLLEWWRFSSAQYAADVEKFSTQFTRKNSAQKDNDLEDVIAFLERRYAQLGLYTFRQTFKWRGIPQVNLIAKIPGTLPAWQNNPVVLIDHIDTAFAEDVFQATGERVSSPGADDNATAVAALMQAGAVLVGSKPKHDIWLAHTTGEEFPGDSLGARRLIEELLEQKQTLSGVLVLDMLGHVPATDPKPLFQINLGLNAGSQKLGALVLSASQQVAVDYTPKVRFMNSPKSYLANTDAIAFSEAGFPVVLINEHINFSAHLNRPHYHMSSDTVAHVDFAYAAALSRTAILAAATLAEVSTVHGRVGSRPAPTLPVDALALPTLRQQTTHTCGPAALLSVLRGLRAFSGSEQELATLVGTTIESGTAPQALAQGARALGLDAEVRTGLGRHDLLALLRQGKGVILGIQAWRELHPGTPARSPVQEWVSWKKEWNSGHYVALIGMDEHYAYFMDPSLGNVFRAADGAGRPQYGFIPLDELESRWHDEDFVGDRLWRHSHAGVVVSGSRELPRRGHQQGDAELLLIR